jgi:hypothetical protein
LKIDDVSESQANVKKQRSLLPSLELDACQSKLIEVRMTQPAIPKDDTPQWSFNHHQSQIIAKKESRQRI